MIVTCDFGENKRQGHVTLPCLKFDMRHWGPPSRAPMYGEGGRGEREREREG